MHMGYNSFSVGQASWKLALAIFLTSVLSAILREEPKPVSEVVASVPREVERVITRCLRKDPRRRFQHMDDLKVALEELKEESDSGPLAATPPGPPTTKKQ